MVENIQQHVQLAKTVQLAILPTFPNESKEDKIHQQWLIAQLAEHSLSVMKDPGSNLCSAICLFCY
jgi:hypothetical protein